MRRRSAYLAASALMVVPALTGCGSDDPPNSPSPSATVSKTPSVSISVTPSATATTSATPSTAPSASLRSVPVYYVGESRDSFRLYREFRTVPNAGGMVASAVSAMTRLSPLDPNYSSPWRPASRVSVSQRGTALKVDLSADAFSNSNVGSELAAIAVQQLVYTATAAASQSGSAATTVTITKDGKAADVWGVLRIGTATARAPMADVQAQAWVVSPQQGDDRKAGKVVFTGFGTSFEATFGWVVRSVGGAKVAQGSAMGGTGTGGFGSLTFSAQLSPGTYTVTLSTDDPSGGAEGHGPATDDKTFTVR